MSEVARHSVLFACTRNAIRSPMAAAIMRARFGARTRAESAGLVAGDGDPFADAVMGEWGIAIERSAQSLDVIADGRFDLVVALSHDAFACARGVAEAAGVACELWPVPDPSVFEGSREQRLAAYREVRDQLAAWIDARFASRGA
jgi:protein-tyrosine-phosphatase